MTPFNLIIYNYCYGNAYQLNDKEGGGFSAEEQQNKVLVKWDN